MDQIVRDERAPSAERRGVNFNSRRELLDKLIQSLYDKFGCRLVSVVLFGSVARGTDRKESDMDLLIIHDEKRISHRQFRDEFLDLKRNLAANRQQETECSGATGFPVVSSVIMSRLEAQTTPYVLLDIVDEGIVLFDPDGFFNATRERIRTRLRELGSKRIFLDDGSWYWNLKPGAKLNEVITI